MIENNNGLDDVSRPVQRNGKLTYLPGVTVTILFPFKPVESPAIPINSKAAEILKSNRPRSNESLIDIPIDRKKSSLIVV